MNDILPAPQVNGRKALFSFLYHAVTAGVFNENVAISGIIAKSDGLRRSDIPLQVLEHLGTGRSGSIDTHQFLTIFTVEGIEIGAASGSPGLLQEGSMKLIDLFFLIDNKNIDDIVSDRRIGPYIVAIW